MFMTFEERVEKQEALLKDLQKVGVEPIYMDVLCHFFEVSESDAAKLDGYQKAPFSFKLDDGTVKFLWEKWEKFEIAN